VFELSLNGCKKGIPTVAKKVLSTVKIEVFPQLFHGEKMVFQRSFHGGVSILKMKNVWQRLQVLMVQASTMKKVVFPQLF